MGAVERGGQGGQAALRKQEKGDARTHGQQVIQVQNLINDQCDQIQITFAFRWLPRHQKFPFALKCGYHATYLLSQHFNNLHF